MGELHPLRRRVITRKTGWGNSSFRGREKPWVWVREGYKEKKNCDIRACRGGMTTIYQWWGNPLRKENSSSLEKDGERVMRKRIEV